MKVKLKNLLPEFIAVVYDENGDAVLPNHWFYELKDDVEYKIICAKHTYLYRNGKIKEYNYL